MKRIAQAYTKKPAHLQPLVSYITRRRENDLIDFLEAKQVDTGTSQKDLIDAAMLYLAQQQKKGNFKKAIKEIYELHPDKNAILQIFAKQENFDGEEKEEPSTKPKGKENFFKTPLFRLLAVLLSVLILVVVISKLEE